jgi:hypothetical protein
LNAASGSSFPKNWKEVAEPRAGTYQFINYNYAGSGYVPNPNVGQSPDYYWNPTLTQNWFFIPRWYRTDETLGLTDTLFLPSITYPYDGSEAGYFDIPDGYTFNLAYIQQAGNTRELHPLVRHLVANPLYTVVGITPRETPTELLGWGEAMHDLTIWPVTVAKSGSRDVGIVNPLGVSADDYWGGYRYTMYVGLPTVYDNFPWGTSGTKHHNLPWWLNNVAYY